MAITFYCQCGQKLQVPEQMAGRTGKCPTCGAAINVPGQAGAAAPVPPPAPYPPPPTSPPPPLGMPPRPTAAPQPPPPPFPAQPGAPAAQAGMKNCPACGTAILATARKCKHCGEYLTHTLRQARASAPTHSPYQPAAGVGTDGMSVASLVLGILSIPTCICYGVGGFLFGILGLIFGIIGKKNIASTGKQGGGMALAGIICGSIGMALGIIYILLVVLAGVSGAFDQPQPGNQGYEQPTGNDWDD